MYILILAFLHFFISDLQAVETHPVRCPNESALFQRSRELFDRGQYLLSAQHFSILSLQPCSPELMDNGLFGYAASMAELSESGEVIWAVEKLRNSSSELIRSKARLLSAFHLSLVS